MLEFSSENIKIVSSHSNSVLLCNRFDNNTNIEHYFTIDCRGVINEFNIINQVLYASIKLARPSDDVLLSNNHQLKIKKNLENELITSILFIGNKFYLGYEDGLITVWKQNVENNSKLNHSSEDKVKQELKITRKGYTVNPFYKKLKNVEEERQDTLSSHMTERSKRTDRLREKEQHQIKHYSYFTEIKNEFDLKEGIHDNIYENLNESKDSYNNEQEVISSSHLSYFNHYELEYILIGQQNKIINLTYIPNKNYLVSCSNDSIVKIWDTNTGLPIFNFNLDINFNQIVTYQDKKSDDTVLLLFSTEPYYLTLNISKDPIYFLAKKIEHSKFNSFKEFKVTYEVEPEDPKAKKIKKDDAKKKEAPKGKQKPIKLVKIEFDLIVFCGNSSNLVVYDKKKNMEFMKELKLYDLKNNQIQHFIIYDKYYILICGDYRAYVTEINFNTGKYSILFCIQLAEDTLLDASLVNKEELLISSEDLFCYKLNIKKEIDLYYTRQRMIQEDEESLKMNIAYLKLLEKNNKKRNVSAKKKGSRPNSTLKKKKK